VIAGFRPQNHPQQVRRRGALHHVDDRAFPREAFEVLQRRFRFTLDAAASAENRKLRRYFSIENCGLRNSWAGERVYCNPPFSDLRPWIAKAWKEHRAILTVLLLPANRTEQGWWQDSIEPRRDQLGSPLRVEFLRGRNRFLSPAQREIRPNERPPFGCCLCIWNWEGAEL
jgi:phage N-6-adenine-methyltransferase